jgi:hypothetical protein
VLRHVPLHLLAVCYSAPLSLRPPLAVIATYFTAATLARLPLPTNLNTAVTTTHANTTNTNYNYN